MGRKDERGRGVREGDPAGVGRGEKILVALWSKTDSVCPCSTRSYHEIERPPEGEEESGEKREESSADRAESS